MRTTSDSTSESDQGGDNDDDGSDNDADAAARSTDTSNVDEAAGSAQSRPAATVAELAAVIGAAGAVQGIPSGAEPEAAAPIADMGPARSGEEVPSSAVNAMAHHSDGSANNFPGHAAASRSTVGGRNTGQPLWYPYPPYAVSVSAYPYAGATASSAVLSSEAPQFPSTPVVPGQVPTLMSPRGLPSADATARSTNTPAVTGPVVSASSSPRVIHYSPADNAEPPSHIPTRAASTLQLIRDITIPRTDQSDPTSTFGMDVS